MSQLTIGQVIYELRKEKGITQEQLAQFMGVSAAAVSKWEKGASYPDITLLPQLATFFQVTIDRLLNYNITLSDEEVMGIYQECEKKFNDGTSIEEALDYCRGWVRKYPQCYLLAFRMAFLFQFYGWKLGDEAKMNQIMAEGIGYLENVVDNSTNTELVEGALFQLGALYAGQQNYEQAIERLNRIPKSHVNPNDLLPSIYIMQGEFKDGKKILQSKLFKGVNDLAMACQGLANIALKESNDGEKAERYHRLAIDIKSTIGKGDERGLSLFNEYYQLAELYIKQGDEKKSVGVLEQMVDNLKQVDLHDAGQISNLWCFDELELRKSSLTLNLYENMALLFQQECFDPIRKGEGFQGVMEEVKKLEEDFLRNIR